MKTNPLKIIDLIFLGWIGAVSLISFIQFGWDKRRARLFQRRISEWNLIFSAAMGGWPGAFVGMQWFRHKTAKQTFLVKFAWAFFVFAAMIFFYLRWRLTP